MHLKKTLGIVLVALCCNQLMQQSVAGAAVSASQPQPPLAGSSALSSEEVLVDVVMNRQSAGTQVCYHHENDYWIPFELFKEQMGLKSGETTQNTLTCKTSLGTITFNRDALKVFGNREFISLTELRKTFLVSGGFNPSSFSIQLEIPWYIVTGNKKEKAAAVIPDIHAPNSSLSFLRFQPDLSYDFDKTFRKNIFLETGGRVANGVWDVTLEGDPETSIKPTHYSWTTYNNNLAVRLGTGNSSVYPLVDDTAFTGVQFGWNNHSILNQLDFERYSDSDFFLSLDRTQQRTIEGKAPPAAIAELRMDGLVVARQRVGLDGIFIFSNVRMSTDLRKTEVLIYERSLREKPLMVLDYTISILNRSLPAHEILVRGGTGVSGNPLIKGTGKNVLTGFSHVMYGLNDRITLEAGLEQNPGTDGGDWLAGSVISLGKNWAAALYGARSNEHYGADTRLEGHGRNWDFAWQLNWHERGFSNPSNNREANHMVRLSTKIVEQFSILGYGRYDRIDGQDVKKFILPGAYWTVSPSIMLSAIPDDDENYRYETTVRLTKESDLTVSYDKKVVTADCRIDVSRALIGRIIDSYATRTQDNLTSIYLDWYPAAYRYDMLRLGISHSSSATGFSASWSKFVNAGLRLSMQYSYNMNNAYKLDVNPDFIVPSGADANHYIAFAMTWDIGFSKSRMTTINRTAISDTRGGLAGSLDIMNNTRVKPSDINDVDLLLNGRRLGQRQVDGTFFVGNLRPGIYTVGVDTEKLPLELNVSNKNVKVEVKNGAVTEIRIPVYAEFGIAGRISGVNGKGLDDAIVTVTDSGGKSVATAYTNAFGYYRVDGLRSGIYTLEAAGSASGVRKTARCQATVTNDFLFDVNFDLSSAQTTGSPVGSPSSSGKQQ